MKKLRSAILCSLAALLAAAPVLAQPGQVQLAWDASPAASGYRLYAHTNALSATNLLSALAKLDAGTNQTATVADALPGMWHFVATAVNAQGVESLPSNEVITEVPAPPGNLRTVTLQFNATVTGTNWLNAGFFRVKFE